MTIGQIALFLLLWICCGLAGAGFLFRHLQAMGVDDEQTLREDLGFCLLYAITGPVVLIVGFLLSGFGYHGWWFYRRRTGG